MAGIGRTGCLLAIMNGIRQLQRAKRRLLTVDCVTDADDDAPLLDVLAIVCNLRLQRGGMVQNSNQYELVHRVLCIYEYREGSDTSDDDSDDSDDVDAGVETADDPPSRADDE